MNMIDTVKKLVLLAVLGICAAQDARSGKINIFILGAGAVSGVALWLVSGNLSLSELAFAILPGITAGIISLTGSGAIGYADAFLMMNSGLLLGWTFNLMLVFISLLFCMLCSIVLLALKKKRWKDTMPYAPFMLGGFVFMEIAGIC